MFNLGKMKSGGEVGSRSMTSMTTSMSAPTAVAEYSARKRPSVDEGLSLRKYSRRETPEHQANASGSTTVVPSRKGKEPVTMEEAPERGYILRELCEVEDRVGAKRYFATIMMRLKVAEGKDPLMPRWLAIGGYECSSKELINRASKILALRADQDLVTVIEAHVKELEGDINKLRGELESLKTQRRRLEEEGFKSGLEKMGWVSYEFGFRVALERLRSKHPEIEVKQDPFAECPKDANIRIDLSQPSNDSSPSVK
ncbi:hypothetical protein BHE74_00014942 [Ensete ventricosum]|uniref:Uncharacterized protein n=1 Tax=Ensete ventricosum TaxID=4639 RepID=A0A445M9Y9_ENSVE|nr:hypothetical protein BHE74_00014942 [Ensete ventricosum]RZR71053.1 hypothetical protein BHM03_00003059 [Ensete ventricosum]